MSGDLASFLPLSPVSSSLSLDNSVLPLWASDSSYINEEIELKYRVLYTHYFCVAMSKLIKYILSIDSFSVCRD